MCFHASVLNIKRAIVCASNVDRYDGKETERSRWIFIYECRIFARLFEFIRKILQGEFGFDKMGRSQSRGVIDISDKKTVSSLLAATVAR